jgi:hypothetical protein
MYRFLLVTALMLGLGFAATAQAGTDEAWRIMQSAGDVGVTTGDETVMATTPRTELPEGAIVTTGQSGRAVISRGQEQVIIQPLTRLVLTRATPGATTILQSAGSAFYRIGKKKTPHFQVDTPYLAAIVKGTAFKVTVDRTRADVMVTEGAVEVSSREGSAVSLVKPGMTATVSHAETRAIDLKERSGTHRLVTTNEGGWSDTGAAEGLRLRPGTSGETGRAGLRTNLSGIREGTIAVEVTSTTDPEALRLSTITDAGDASAASAGLPGGVMLRQLTINDLSTPSGTGRPGQGLGASLIVKDARNAIAGKVESTVRSLTWRKPLKVSATLPWTELFFGLLGLIAVMVLSHIRALRARLKKLDPLP